MYHVFLSLEQGLNAKRFLAADINRMVIYNLNPNPWIFGTVTERDFREKIPKHRNIDAMLCLGIFPENALGDGPAFRIFSKIHG